ncbi:MAG: Rpn family recombination-promoting nuclease/putative transposase [Candidatus Xenobiia bacterium LiM19]
MAHKTRSRGDDGWKIVLGHYLDDFLDFFFPHISEETERGRHSFLDNELQSLSRRVGIGKRITDKLVKVFLRNGEEKWLLIHVEVQGEAEKGFEERLFIYSYRIYDRYRRDVATLAVLADDSRDFRPSGFEMGRWGCRHRFEFPSVKIFDYRERIDELERSMNPFAVVVLAHLRHYETERETRKRLFWKLSLVKDLDRKGFGGDVRTDLYLFIDWLLALPEPLEIEFNEEMIRYEEGKEMAYITSAERLGIKKGRKEGRKEGREEGRKEGRLEGIVKGKLETALTMLREGYSRETVKKLTGLTEEQLAGFEDRKDEK